MTIHVDMFGHKYPSALVWNGIWETPDGLCIDGFHLWDRRGRWVGVYKTFSRATSEASHT